MKKIAILMAVLCVAAFGRDTTITVQKDGKEYSCPITYDSKEKDKKKKEKKEIEEIEKGIKKRQDGDVSKCEEVQKEQASVADTTTNSSSATSISSSSEENNHPESSASKATEYPNENDKPNIDKPNIPREIIILLAVLSGLFLMLIIFRFSISKQKKRIDSLESKTKLIGDNFSYSQKENKKLQDEISELKKEIEKLKNFQKTEISGKVPQTQFNAPFPPQQPLPPPPPPLKKKEIFYLPGPSGDYFMAEKASRYFVEYTSLYRFEKFEGESKASVYVENRPDVVQRFVDAPERQRGVCEEGMSFNSNATSIETEAPGEAVLEGDKWRVEEKIKIRYCEEG